MGSPPSALRPAAAELPGGWLAVLLCWRELPRGSRAHSVSPSGSVRVARRTRAQLPLSLLPPSSFIHNCPRLAGHAASAPRLTPPAQRAVDRTCGRCHHLAQVWGRALCWGPGTAPLQLTSQAPPGRVWKWPAARRPLCRVCRAGTCVGRVGVYACSVCAGRHLCLCARVSMRHARSWVCVHCHVRAPGAGRYSRRSTPHGPRS